MIVPQLMIFVKVVVRRKQVVMQNLSWRSLVPTADARSAEIASDDTRRSPRPPKRTGRLACNH